MNNYSSDKYIQNTSLTLFQLSLLLLLATSIVRFSSSMYLPALLKIGSELNLSDNLISQTLTIFYIFFAISTLFVGPIVDSYGRKNAIMIGAVVFIFGSLLCANSTSWESLMIGRIFQAVGTSFIPVASRAMLRDLCNDRQIISILGWMALLGGVIPIIAPVLGGVIIKFLSWRYIFWFLSLFSTTSLIFIIAKLPNSVSKDKLKPFNIKIVLENYLFILKSPKFFIIVTPLALAFSIQGAYLVTSPFIFMQHFKLSPIEFGLINVIIVLSMFSGKYIASYTIKKRGIFAAYTLGAFLTFIGALCISITVAFGLDTIHIIIILLSVMISGYGTLLPIGVKSIMTAFKDHAGITSALHGFVTLGMTAIGSLIVTQIRDFYQTSYIDSLNIFLLPTVILLVISAFFTKEHLI